MAEEIERIYVVPLKKNGFKSSKAAPSAVKRVKSYLTRHMKVEEKDIWIDDSLNNALWSKGKYKMASKIRVKAVKFDDGVVEAYLPELEFKKSRRELLKEEKAKKEPILKKEEMEGEGEGETGTEDYEIAPAADGDVKIKKKKAPKSEKDKKPAEKKPAKAKEKPKKKDTKTEPAKKKPAAKKTTKKESKPKTAKKTASKPKATKKKSTSQKKK
jgi:large subunit ribosomal protein L31e